MPYESIEGKLDFETQIQLIFLHCNRAASFEIQILLSNKKDTLSGDHPTTTLYMYL